MLCYGFISRAPPRVSPSARYTRGETHENNVCRCARVRVRELASPSAAATVFASSTRVRTDDGL